MDQDYTLKELAEKIKKDSSTISKEIKRNRITKESKKKEDDLHPCQHRKSCNKTNLSNEPCGKNARSVAL